MSEIKLPFVIEHRVFNILLQNEGTKFAIAVSLSSLQSDLDIVDIIAYCDSVSSIGIFPWFDDPYVLHTFFSPFFLFNGLVCL